MQATDPQILTGTVRVDSDELRWVLAAARLLLTHSRMPAARQLLLESTASTLTLTAHDGQTAYRQTIPADGEGGMALVALPALRAALGKHSGPVSLRVDGPHLTVAVGRTITRLRTLPTEDRASPPTPPTDGVVLDAAQVAEIARRVVPAASCDRAFPVLNHVLVEAGSGPAVTVAALDRYRLAVLRLDAQVRSARCRPAALIPAAFIVKAARALRDAEATALSWDDQHAGLIAEHASIVTRLGGGDFPPYRQLLAPPERELLVPRDPLRRAIAHIRGPLDGRCPVTLTFRRSTVTLANTYENQASISTAVDLVTPIVGEFQVAFNPAFLDDALAAQDAAVVRVGITSPTKPVWFTTGGNYVHLLVPCHLT